MENRAYNPEGFSVYKNSENEEAEAEGSQAVTRNEDKQEQTHIAGDNRNDNEKEKKSNFGGKVLNGVAIGGLALGQSRGAIEAIKAQRLAEEQNSDLNNPAVTQTYHKEAKEEDQEFYIDQSMGSGLDKDGFPVEKEVVLQAPLQNEIESYEAFAEIIPTLAELKEYELIESEKIDSYEDTRAISDYVNIYSFPLKEDMFPGDKFRVSTVKVDKYLDSSMNIEDQDTQEEIKGLGFSVHNILTLQGPQGDTIKLGEYHNLYGWYTRSYLLMEYQDAQGNDYKFTTNNLTQEEKNACGYSENSFLEVSHKLYDSMVRDNEQNDSIITQEYELDKELKTSLVQEIYDIQDLRELKEISEKDKSIRVILGITEAINSYPGDEVVTDEYLQEMISFNKENYGIEPVVLGNNEVQPENMTKYLLNYVNKEGQSWYQNYLDFQNDIQTWYKEHLELKRNPWGYNTFYNDGSKMIRDLNLLSATVKGNEGKVQPFGVANLYRNLIGIPAPMVMSAPVENVRELIPSEISQYDGGYFFSGMIRDTYISPHFEDYSDVKIGDMLVSQEKNHLITIFYESENEQGNTKWAFDTDEDGLVRLYQWNNDGKRLYPIGPLSSPYGRYDLLRHVKNMPYERKQAHWEVKYDY